MAPTAEPAKDGAPLPVQPDAPFRKFPTIPNFNLLKVDSTTYLTKADLKKGHLTLVMYFSPDCDHCKHQTENILADIAKFKNIEIVMATYQPFDQMKDFYAHFEIAKYPNIKMGRDEKFFMAPFYRIRNLPYLALYDKNGQLITSYEGTQTAKTILDGFEQK
jgi:thiol-disulfide isomerase/thioredoxin